jgi:hypothetical protein
MWFNRKHDYSDVSKVLFIDNVSVQKRLVFKTKIKN